MDARGIDAIVRTRINSGALPKRHPYRVFAGPSQGQTCDVRGEKLTTGTIEIEIEVDSFDARTRFYHRGCYGALEKSRDP
jgi:hypothetical protein